MTAPLEHQVGHLLRDLNLTVAVAESCTGGLIGHRLTNVPGSSAYFLGGVLAYSNAVKAQLLGVQEESLAVHGAVSSEVACEMAAGVRKLLAADLALSVTGIAGPGGDTPTKPVGLTYVGFSTVSDTRAYQFVWQGDREANKAQSAEAALQVLFDYLLTLSPPGSAE